jgi:hypothetical protein
MAASLSPKRLRFGSGRWVLGQASSRGDRPVKTDTVRDLKPGSAPFTVCMQTVIGQRTRC